ncbi:hypothetical protein J3U01_01520 [Bifidobacterium sp. B4107]|uniref:hypothetical protein n=1 Tax=unclassified Bifidobacterium TaxID=2608897 RepID=UPI00226B59F4|nr:MULTISPECIES: hypothetical protein [unclassified Bifidobacterium]MCX8647101.1 hypothetical protein [Bifidobacterium sp. B4107]MCX8651281.1 hypothetical protein [Bifidobacterium sp. B4111]MCX8657711.1 hypothetical protein [Bifidobacterium sp. B4114]
MSEKPWYEGIARDEIEGKHVRAVMDSGTVIEGRLAFWGKWMVTAGSPIEGNYVLGGSEESRWELTERVECLDLVWDERDWTRIDVRDLRDGDAVVANGRLYRVAVSWVHEDPPQVVTDTPSRMRIDLSLVSCALRRKTKVHIPATAGFYKDRTGSYWVRAWMPGHDKPWRAVDPYAFDFPVRSEDEMFSRMPLTPVHFVDGRAPKPGDELASVMRITSKGVTFTTEAA